MLTQAVRGLAPHLEAFLLAEYATEVLTGTSVSETPQGPPSPAQVTAASRLVRDALKLAETDGTDLTWVAEARRACRRLAVVLARQNIDVGVVLPEWATIEFDPGWERLVFQWDGMEDPAGKSAWIRENFDKFLGLHNLRLVQLVYFVSPNLPGIARLVEMLTDARRQLGPTAVETLRAEATEAPEDPGILGTYALYLWNDPSGPPDLALAAEYFERALTIDPEHAVNLGNYALFLDHTRGNIPAARKLHIRAIAAQPSNSHILLNYALFLKDNGASPAEVEAAFDRALSAGPTEVEAIGAYAQYLGTTATGAERADILFRRAMTIDPSSRKTFHFYVDFLLDVVGDRRAAREILEAFADNHMSRSGDQDI
jgi:tetratricopeptide (TPR) repeat protein